MRFWQFSTITAVTLGFFLISGFPSQNLASTLTVTIELPKQGETIKTPVYNDMRGKYAGEIPKGYKLWVLAKDPFNFFLMYPPPSVVKSTKSWSQTNVRLSPGRWELHVCLANETASRWLENRAASGIGSGFPSLPEGMETVKSIVVNRK